MGWLDSNFDGPNWDGSNWSGEAGSDSGDSVTESMNASDALAARLAAVATLGETCSASDSCSAVVIPAPPPPPPPSPPPYAGGAGIGFYPPDSMPRVRVVRPSPRPRPVHSGVAGVDLVPALDEDAYLGLQRELELLRSRYERHTKYLRQRLGNQETELGQLHAQRVEQDAIVLRLTTELNAMKQQLDGLQARLIKMTAPVPRCLLLRASPTKMAAPVPRVLLMKPKTMVVPVPVPTSLSGVPERPSMAPFLWAAAGAGIGALLLPRNHAEHKKTLLVLAGSILLVGAVRWVRGR